MKRSKFYSFLEASKSNHKEVLEEAHKIARGILDVKDLLEKVVELKDNPDIKKSLVKLHELDVSIEFLINEIEKIK